MLLVLCGGEVEYLQIPWVSPTKRDAGTVEHRQVLCIDGAGKCRRR